MSKHAMTAALAAFTPCVVAMVAAAPAAATGPLLASARCDETRVDRVFLRWADAMHYFLAPNGDFESGAAGWALDGAARTVGDNEPWHVSGGGDDSALELEVGSRATTSPVCVGLAEPTLRFFAKRVSGSSLSLLQVDVLFEDASGRVNGLCIGAVVSDGSWKPTARFPLLVNLLPLLPGDKAPVAFRFTPRGDGDWRLDGVHVDPWRQH